MNILVRFSRSENFPPDDHFSRTIVHRRRWRGRIVIRLGCKTVHEMPLDGRLVRVFRGLVNELERVSPVRRTERPRAPTIKTPSTVPFF